MSIEIGAAERAALEAYSRGEMDALELRRRLDDATYGEVLRLLSLAHLPLPRIPTTGREDRLALARKWLFRTHEL